MQKSFSNKRKEFGGKGKNHGDRRKFQRPKAQSSTKYQGPNSQKREVEGTIKLAGRKGGFVLPEGFKDEINIPPMNLSMALHGDRVLVKLRSKDTGEVVKILERARKRFVGMFVDCKFVADDRRMYLEVAVRAPEIKDEKVLVEITDWHSAPIEGKIVATLGKKGEHETEMKSILAAGGIVYNFEPEVEKEASEIQARATELMAKEAKVRRDMRDTPTFTIDPADAKDFDDALSIREIPNPKVQSSSLYEVGIHIADVSYFVRPGTALDREAAERANSVYLVDRTIPMLPEALSADICSLVPDQDRLTYSAIFVLDKTGKVHEEWFGRTIIHSHKRFTYQEAAEVLATKKGPYSNELAILSSISQELLKERLRQGSIIFDKDEVHIELDAAKKPVRIYIKERLPTHKLIEEFMLLANKHVAHFLFKAVGKHGGASMYRIHEKPDPERIGLLKTFLRTLGYKIEGDIKNFGAPEIKKLFDEIEGEEVEGLVHTAVLRSMAKAVYSTRNIGHFGLGFEFYTHFTSPIRRYPDTVVHRLLTKYLAGKAIEPAEVANFERMARYSSVKEKEAADAERESVKYKQAEFMLERLQNNSGQEYDGLITGVTEWGIYAEDTVTKCEGMLRLSSLGDDYYEFDEKKFALVGRKTKKTYRLGDKIKLKLAEVDVPRHQITWGLGG
ncbi:MAG TPA: ribonuclease R [Candidatus Paceibacterota bacterium]